MKMTKACPLADTGAKMQPSCVLFSDHVWNKNASATWMTQPNQVHAAQHSKIPQDLTYSVASSPVVEAFLGAESRRQWRNSSHRTHVLPSKIQFPAAVHVSCSRTSRPKTRCIHVTIKASPTKPVHRSTLSSFHGTPHCVHAHFGG